MRMYLKASISKQALNLSSARKTMRRRSKKEWARSYTLEPAGTSIEELGRVYGARME